MLARFIVILKIRFYSLNLGKSHFVLSRKYPANGKLAKKTKW